MRGRMLGFAAVAAACVSLPMAVAACSGGSSGGGGAPPGTGDAATPADAGSPPSSDGALASRDGALASGDGALASCAEDPLKTGLVAMQTGVSVDAFDCPILQWAASYGEADPMIFKAIIYVESRFDENAIACPNMPCGVPTGWTAAESGCFGLMQIVPACGGSPGDAGLLANGQPDMVMSMSQSGWAGSVFNPNVNIEIGIAGVHGNRMQEMQKFPGCTTDQYTLMAVGDYNSYGSTKSCTEYNTAYDDPMLMAYTMYATAAGYAAHPYPP